MAEMAEMAEMTEITEITEITDIYTFIGAHIDNRTKLQDLIRLCTTKQVDYIGTIKILVSISVEADLLDEAVFLLSTTNTLYYIQSDVLSAFQHYQYLCNTIPDDTWVLTSEVDAEWAVNRLGAYQQMIAHLPESKVDCISYNNKNLLYNYCVRAELLRQFITGLSNAQISNNLCRYFFIKYLHVSSRIIYCQTNEELYKCENVMPELTTDLYIALFPNPTAIDFMKVCGNNKDLLSTYLESYRTHIFADQYLPEKNIS